ncbi:MAG: outer membrane protein [Chlamydiales bacterium]|jgi:NodT family efflux transporter outer membrane factor (OMF) lipoprotein|nr:outer membrane protein [Chlamydiales bacterium]
MEFSNRLSYTYLSIHFLFTTFVSGCVSKLDYQKPNIPIATDWTSFYERPKSTSFSHKLVTDLNGWGKLLQDPLLEAWIQKFQTYNLDLKLAALHILELRTTYNIAEKELYPHLQTRGQAAKQQQSLNSPVRINLPPAFTSGSSRKNHLFQIGFDAQWELDLFGAIGNAKQASLKEIYGALASQQDLRATLLAELINSYITMRSLQQQISIHKQHSEVQEETLILAKAKLRSGLISELDVLQSEAQLAMTYAQLPALQKLYDSCIYRIATLLKENPKQVTEQLHCNKNKETIQSWWLTPEWVIPIDTPSEVLRRRPDIRKAEYELAAATARTQAAIADFFPHFSLIGSIGQLGSHHDQILQSNSSFWSFGPSVNWSLLDFGRVRIKVNVHKIRQEAALVRYEQVIYKALEEVENRLTNYSYTKTKVSSLEKAVDANNRSLKLAKELYSQGILPFLNVLEAQNNFLNSHLSLVQSQTEIWINLVSLAKALGPQLPSTEEE